MPNIFSSENRIFIVFSFRKFARIQFTNFILFSLCWSVSNGSVCILYTWSSRSLLSILWTLLREIPNSPANFREDSGFCRFNRLLIFWIAAFVRIVLEHPRGLSKSMVPTSRILLQHHSIVERLMAPLRCRKIFVVSSPLSYFESTSFYKSLLLMLQNGYKVVRPGRFSMVL